jgi:hypothetical protein
MHIIIEKDIGWSEIVTPEFEGRILIAGRE